MSRVRVAVAGANGYAGMTLVSLLDLHPAVELAQLTSRSFADRPYQAVFPLLEREGDFLGAPKPELVDVIFSCLPHNVGANLAAEWLAQDVRVIDLSADFRLRDSAQYPRWYGQDHPCPELLAQAVFGLPELHAAELPQARLIAVPGCYSTAAILALAPAVKAGLVGSDIVVDAKSGVSGAGRSPGLSTHFSEVNDSVHAYAVNGHRHLAELTQELCSLAPAQPPHLTFVPHMIPMVRGILATCYFDLSTSREELERAYEDFYAGQPFTRVLPQPAATKLAAHNNRCLINVSQQGPKAVVTAAIDNLVKGAAGQAVECFNLAFGFERAEGLRLAAQWP
ncbi:MAG: N-acetyl-gamma-glutamyl-phosphate reductase [Candidatus Dormibacteraeota bacterium]|nr:N-acetyl-gamma-glutamyl-phosphate reductase [Candidatus Dormibacteraeota bacterium]